MITTLGLRDWKSETPKASLNLLGRAERTLRQQCHHT
jgi:hypothetical protein